PRPNGGHDHGTTHQQEHIEFLQPQHLADYAWVRQARPGHDGPEASTEHEADNLRRAHRPVRATHATTWASATAVPTNVIDATKLAGEPMDVPVTPCPDVQPPAMRAPKPMATPATSSIAACAAGFVPTKIAPSDA